MQEYNWKDHYSPQLIERASDSQFQKYDIENESGTGKVISCIVFPGVQAVYNDLHFGKCGKTVSKNDKIIEISYCMDGRYECEVNNQYCFYISHGNLTLGTVGRREACGSFPSKRYAGLTIFLDCAAMKEHYSSVIQELEINLDRIYSMAVLEPRRFILRGIAEIDSVFEAMINAQIEENMPLMKLKTLELFLILGKIDPEINEQMVYLNHTQAKLAKTVQQMLVADLATHITLEQISGELRVSTSSIKRCFKAVYGETIRKYMKSYRLNEACRLLRETQLPIAEVAVSVGYQNAGHFSEAFKKKYHMLPGEYKKRVQFEQ